MNTDNARHKKVEDAQPKESTKSLVTKLVLVPLLIVSVAVGVFLFFGWLTYDQRSAQEFLADIKTASPAKKWQSAFVLAGKLRSKDDIENADGLYREMAAIFKNTEHYDEQVRSYMAMALGNLGDMRAIPVLEASVREETGDVPIYAMWALGTLGARESLPLLKEKARSDDQAIRKTALFVLGSVGDHSIIPILKAALADEQIDVRWNAALALARVGDAGGLELITRLLDRDYFKQFPEMGTRDQTDAMINALRAVQRLKAYSLKPRVELISQNDIDMQVRRAAHETLSVLQDMQN